MSTPLSAELVTWAYRILLDREPENDAVVLEKAHRFTCVRDLRHEFLHSEEFRYSDPQAYLPALTGNEPPMQIEAVRSAAQLQQLFQHIQTTWQSLGETEPYWSVLSGDQFTQAHIEATKEAFYHSGQRAADLLFNTLRRHNIDPTSFTSCLEYGCGLGRVTRWLAERFEHVVAYDISRSHLQFAQTYIHEQGLHNVEVRHLQHVQNLDTLPQTDVVYSILVLQHNPPPIIAIILHALLRSLKPGGVAFLQVPTYQLGYSFSLQTYLNTAATQQKLEMHVLPQSEVFEIVRQAGASVLEVLEDDWTGFGYNTVSNTFLIQKPAGTQ